jgi:hypothetical protein
MKRNLKILGLALASVLAMSAVAVSAASAVEFKSESSPTVLTGEQKEGTNEVFTTMGGTVTCENVTYVGSMSGTSSTELEVAPTYSGCTAFGFSTLIHVNGCKFKFTVVGSVHIVCPTGKAIEITAPGCTITVPTQTPTGGAINYLNLGTWTGRVLEFIKLLTGIHYIEHNKGIFPTCSNPEVTTTDGTYSGESIIKGENESGVQHGIWVE